MASFRLVHSVKGPGKLVFKTGYFILDAGTSSVTTWNDERDIWRVLLSQQFTYSKGAATATATFSAFLKSFDSSLVSHLWLRFVPTALTTGGGYPANPSASMTNEIPIALVGGGYQFSVLKENPLLVASQQSITVSQAGADMGASTSVIRWAESENPEECFKLL